MEPKKRNQKNVRKFSLAMAAAVVATSTAMGAPANKSAKSSAAVGLVAPAVIKAESQDFKSILNSRMDLIRGNGTSKSSFLPNMSAIMAKIAPYCSKANEILAQARQESTWQIDMAKLNNPQSLFAPGNTLAKGLSDAAQELLVGDGEGLNKLHFAIAVVQAAEVSKSFVDVIQKNMTNDSTALVGRVSYNFHSQLMKLIEFADVQLDRQYVIPYYQSCGMSPIVVLPPLPPPPPPGHGHPHNYSTQQHPYVNQHGAPIAQGPITVHPGIPGYHPGWGMNCGLQIVYVNQVKQLAVQFLELAHVGNHWTGFANNKVQFTVLKSLSSAARTTLVMSEVYNPYYLSLIRSLENLEMRIDQALKYLDQNTDTSEYMKGQILAQYQHITEALKQVSDYMPQYTVIR